MKKSIIVILLVMLIVFNVYAVEITDLSENQDSPQTNENLLQVRADVKSNNEILQQLPTENTLNANFQQLDSKLTGLITELPLTFLALIIGIILFNDLLIFSIILLLKYKRFL